MGQSFFSFSVHSFFHSYERRSHSNSGFFFRDSQFAIHRIEIKKIKKTNERANEIGTDFKSQCEVHANASIAQMAQNSDIAYKLWLAVALKMPYQTLNQWLTPIFRVSDEWITRFYLQRNWNIFQKVCLHSSEKPLYAPHVRHRYTIAVHT